MIDYRLDDLGWFEFEQLGQSLLKDRLGLGVEAWGGRADWGRDAYFEGCLNYPTNEPTSGSFLFQCKFVENANAAGAKPHAALLAAVREECIAISKRLPPTGPWSSIPNSYSLLTNSPVPPKVRMKVVSLIRDALPNCMVSVHGGNDICQWLRASPEIARSFPQLLSLRDLQELLRASVHSETIVRSQSAIALAQAHSRVFVPTKAYYMARETLRHHHFVVLEGPPEMGKTTIGRIIALSQVCSGWDAIECRNASEFLSQFVSERRQVFVADDFFGRTEYEPMRVTEWQSELAHILPLLGSTHWLILTCRAHLLEMAKANLDIAGQNDRFPCIGEIVVDAGNLDAGEKARILYRHAKAAQLSHAEKVLVKNTARQIVENRHFTPERIRRLVHELIPKLVTGDGTEEKDIPSRVAEALRDPTKQMRVSFRNLPTPHRWLLYALLESDRLTVSELSDHGLRKRYEELCPPSSHKPFARVRDELTEGFVRKTSVHFGISIDWIHPSCRDLAIDELSERVGDRQRLLKKCSVAGLALASSVGGGANGERILPLLQTEKDWQCFQQRSIELATTKQDLLPKLWSNYKALTQEASKNVTLRVKAERLRILVSDHLLPLVARLLGPSGLSHLVSLRLYFEVCQELKVQTTIDFGEALNECSNYAERWDREPFVLWQDDGTPGEIHTFLRILQEFQPSMLDSIEGRSCLNSIASHLIERGVSEGAFDFNRPKNHDEVSERANAFEQVSSAFDSLSKLTVFEEKQRDGFKEVAGHLKYQAESLLEDMPQEPDWDEGSHRQSSADEVDIGELFRDL